MKNNRTSEFGYARCLVALTLCAASLALMGLSITAAPSAARKARVQSVDSRLSASNKVAPWVVEHTAGGGEAEFLIVLADQADLSGAAALPTKDEKGRYVRETLWNKAQATQGPLLEWLRARNIPHRPYYIVNLIWAKGTTDLVQQLANRADVLRIEGNPRILNIAPSAPDEVAEPFIPEATSAIEPGVNYTGAPLVWAMGYTGQGIVVGGADTGYRWDHTALKSHYRGWNGTAANHDYNWHDSIHSGGGPCGPDSVQPCDDNSHGSHTMGTAVGDDGGSNQIGMAPGAKWIGCRNMNEGVGAPATYIECMEFFLAPYPVGGTPAQGDPSKSPHITTNSWGCPPDEGCSADSLKAAVEAQRAAGIMMVTSAGNNGPACGTVQDPPGIYDAVYSVGALNTGADTIATFSSHGPVLIDNSLRLKPDLSAPGTSTRSSVPTSTTSYGSKSGTSMAAPHVAGAAALLMSAYPGLIHDVAMTETILNETAVDLAGGTCDLPTASPNNTFGYGRLNIKAAVDRALTLPRLTGAVSRKVHGDAGTFDINLMPASGSALECRGGDGNHTLVFTFNNNVVSGSATVTDGTGSVSGSSTFNGNT
ncbi:MAG TPA: S8 family serine peptidase, partial [Chthoniobacterales bacterium]|nr:S8 family serine peptidase [Chthoniobacterales bacterium]